MFEIVTFGCGKCKINSFENALEKYESRLSYYWVF